MEIVCMPGPLQKKYKLFHEYIAAGYKSALFDFMAFCQPEQMERREELYDKYYLNGPEALDEIGAIFLPVQPDKMDIYTSFFREECNRRNISVAIGRAPALITDTERFDLEEDMLKLTKLSVEMCKLSGCNKLIVRPLYRMCQDENILGKNIKFYQSIIESAKANGVMILIPNEIYSVNSQKVRGAYSDPYELKGLVDSLNEYAKEDIFGICMDTGVCNLLSQNMYEFCEVVGSRIMALILSENDGVTENRMAPFTAVKGMQSRMDWLNLIRGLRSVRFDGPIICDFTDSQNAVSHMLRPSLIQFQKKTADFIAWQLSIENTIRKYDKRVLFGAGNMCRNYMKCYGEDYRPLYTCDNNDKIWGTTFEGLEIKNPEELKKLPEDYAIFICNIYYDEIEKQLRDMGIKNPIERYNDEYLPSMYTDRFDSYRREVR